MIGAIIITHGDLGQEIVTVAKSIVGQQQEIETITLTPGESPTELKTKIEKTLLKFNQDEGVIIFTDMFGGTPTNTSLPLTLNRKIELLTGVNLPMILEFFSSREVLPLAELVQKIKQTGQKTIINAKEVFMQKLKRS
ncbi:MAG: PTS sugar transporter subunit IIA [bacterium]|nr:PTS sugar transporter subunit IIA [bacterium]